jgi:hypothetical protein
MRRIAPAVAVFFVWAAPAHAKPIVNVQVSSAAAAPLAVTLTASGDAAAITGTSATTPSRTGRSSSTNTGRAGSRRR